MVGRLGVEPSWHGLRVRYINRSVNDPMEFGGGGWIRTNERPGSEPGGLDRLHSLPIRRLAAAGRGAAPRRLLDACCESSDLDDSGYGSGGRVRTCVPF